MEIAVIVIIAVLVAMYYGLGENLEIGSRMATNELKDAERSQKIRIVKSHQKLDVTEDQYKTAVENITKIDELEL